MFMPAPGDSIKVEIDEIGKTFSYNIVTASQKFRNLIKQQTRKQISPKSHKNQLIRSNLIKSNIHLANVDTFSDKFN